MTPLPSVARPPAQLINVNWLVAGLVTIFLLGAGLLLLRSGDDPSALNTAARNGTPVPASTPSQVQAPPSTNSTGPVQGKAITPIQPGQFPDFVGADLVSTLAVLRENQMNYVIIEVADRETPRGLVMSQSPRAGSRAGADSAITIVVSAGVPQ
jgi:hypothetical protein